MADDWATGTFDPNAEDDTRFDHLNFGEGGADGKNAQAIEDEANREVPCAVHTLFVKKVVITTVDSNKDATVKFHDAYLGAEKTGYHAYGGRIEFAMIADPTRTISYTFRTPPSDPGELHIYMTGTSKPNGHPAGQGWYWKTLKHLLGKLGFAIQDNGQLPPDARTFGSWKRWPDGTARTVVAEVIKGTPMEGADPNARVFNQIKPYSYKETPDTLARRGHQVAPTPQPQQQQATATTHAPVAPPSSGSPPASPAIGQRVQRPADDPRNGATPHAAPMPQAALPPAPVAAPAGGGGGGGLNFDDFNV